MNKYLILTDTKDINYDNWRDYVRNHPNGNIFQTPEFFEVYIQTKNYTPLLIAVLDKSKNILGIQVSVITKEFDNIFGYFTSRSIIYGGPLISNDNIEILDIMLAVYKKKIKHRVIYSQYRNMWEWGVFKDVFIKNNIFYEDHLDILFDLTKGEEQLWGEMKRVRRKGINQSYKKGLLIKEIDLKNNELLNDSYLILSSVYRKIKLPFPSKYFFENVIKNLDKKVLSIGLFQNKELVAIRIVVCYNDLVYDWYAGAKEEFLSFRPNDVLPWEIMKLSIKKGFKIFDFGGAGKPNIPYGVREYKLKFGGNLVNYGRFEIVHNKLIMSVASIIFKLIRK